MIDGHHSDRIFVFCFGYFVNQGGVEPLFFRRKKHRSELFARAHWVIRLQADCFTTSPALSAVKTSMSHGNLWLMCPVPLPHMPVFNLERCQARLDNEDFFMRATMCLE